MLHEYRRSLNKALVTYIAGDVVCKFRLTYARGTDPTLHITLRSSIAFTSRSHRSIWCSLPLEWILRVHWQATCTPHPGNLWSSLWLGTWKLTDDERTTRAYLSCTIHSSGAWNLEAAPRRKKQILSWHFGMWSWSSSNIMIFVIIKYKLNSSHEVFPDLGLGGWSLMG
jgi:hypothetical protein